VEYGLAKASLLVGTGGKPRDAASLSRGVGTGLAATVSRGPKKRDFCPG
jgi:hypothetical protein